MYRLPIGGGVPGLMNRRPAHLTRSIGQESGATSALSANRSLYNCWVGGLAEPSRQVALQPTPDPATNQPRVRSSRLTARAAGRLAPRQIRSRPTGHGTVSR
jgi:hypothetical protein